MAFRPDRTDEQGYTYPQLRDTVSGKIGMADTLGIIALITPENVQTIIDCDSRLLGTETQENTTSVAQLYADYEALKTDIAAETTVDGVLEHFTSTNALLAQLSPDFEAVLLSYESYSVADISAFVDDVDEVTLLKEDLSCL